MGKYLKKIKVNFLTEAKEKKRLLLRIFKEIIIRQLYNKNKYSILFGETAVSHKVKTKIKSQIKK